MAGIFGSSRAIASVVMEETEGYDGAIQVTGDLVHPVIFTNYRLQKSEKIQAVEAFSENSHFNAFGKSADMLMLTGNVMVISGDEIQINNALIDKYEKILRAFKAAQAGNLIVVSGPGDLIFTGVANGMEFSAQAEIRSIFPFSLNLLGISQGFAVGDKSTGDSISHGV